MNSVRPAASAAMAVLLCAAGILAQSQGWRAKPTLVEQLGKKQPQFNYDEARVGSYTLPPLFGKQGGASRERWRERRAEIVELFRDNVYGRSPGKPERLRFEVTKENRGAMDGRATLKRIAVVSSQAGREHRFGLTLFLPNSRKDAAPVFLLLNNRPPSNADPARVEKSGFWPAEELVARGYGIAALQVSELAPDDKDKYRDGVIRLFEGPGASTRAPNAWAALAAWGWGASRAMDYFETDARVDARKVAVVGHSRGGKAALWAGAEDERFAIVVSNESGEGGAALARRNYGETLAQITGSFPHWFAPRYTSFADRIADLPVDQHMLLAAIAPRGLYVGSADEDLWADPRGEFLSLAHASPVFALWGDEPLGPDEMPPVDRPLVRGRRGYHVRTGGHNLTPYDWQRFADFADSLWQTRSSSR